MILRVLPLAPSAHRSAQASSSGRKGPHLLKSTWANLRDLRARKGTHFAGVACGLLADRLPYASRINRPATPKSINAAPKLSSD